MDTRSEAREFLTSRRAKITPEQAGLRTYGGATTRAGLRREEVALLAGVSADYYTRLERGNASGVSETVLEALARALQLDDAERAHLFDLARATQTRRPDRRRGATDIAAGRSAHARRDGRGAGVRAQRAARPARAPTGWAARSIRRLLRQPAQPPNTARFVFLDLRARRSISTGSASRTMSSPSFVPRPGATRTTASSGTSSANCRPGASSLERSGRRTTSARTTPVSSASATRSSAS